MTDVEFGSMEVAEAAGIAYQTLHRWCAVDAVRPSIAGAHGIGTRRRWSPQDRDALTDIAVVAEDMYAFEADMPVRLVADLWDACLADPDADVIVLEFGSITVTVDRRDRRAVQARRAEALVRRGLEEA